MELSGRPLTVSIPLQGGQSRLRNVILYVAQKCHGAEYFGAIKLNKIIWKADFDSFADRQKPITGREYRRQKFGPVLKEMPPVRDEMLKDGSIAIVLRDFGNGYVEQRTIALEPPNLSYFDEEDLEYLNESIAYYWEKTGVESSDESHGVAWKTRGNGDPMPYELAYLWDTGLRLSQEIKLKVLLKAKRLVSE